MSDPTVSVVIPVRNAVGTLPACLAALERLDPPPAEIVLVDNGSTDGSDRLLRDFAARHDAAAVKVVDEPRPGVSMARNAAIRAARGDVLAWTDSDCAPATGWLGHLAVPFADPTVGGVAGRVLPASGTSLVELFCGLYTLRSPSEASRHQAWTPWTGAFPTANLAVRRTLLEALGGFDEATAYGEDHDLCARLYATGAAIVYTPAAEVYHHHRTRLRPMVRQAYAYGRSHPYLLRRHARAGLWLELPRASLTWPGCPVPAWLNFASADKKLAGLLILGAFYRPLLALLPVYAAWLAVANARRARGAGARPSLGIALGLSGLLILKSAALSAGRWSGSIRHGTVCF